jgi:capsular exopolysaccharide synthesis family protein
MKVNRFENITFFQLLQLLKHRLWIVGLLLLCGMLIAYLYLRYATLIYKSEAELLIQVGSLTSFDKREEYSESPLFQMDRTSLLKSSLLINEVAKTLNLSYRLYSVGKIGNFEHYGTKAPFSIEFLIHSDSSFHFYVEVSRGKKTFRYGKSEEELVYTGVFREAVTLGNLVFRLLPADSFQFSGLDGLFYVEYIPLQVWNQDIKRNLDVVTRDFTTFKLFFYDSHPERARDILNALIQQYKTQELAIEKQQIEKRLDYLEDVLEKLRDDRLELEKIILFKLEPAEKRQYESIRSVYDELIKKRENYERLRSIFASILNYLDRAKKALSLEGEPIEPFSHLALVGDDWSTLKATFTELNALIDKYNLALNDHQPSSPYVVNLKLKLAYRIDVLENESQNILNYFRRKIDEIENKIKELEQKEIYFQAKSSQINTLQSNYQFVSDLYFSMLKEKYELEIQEASLISNTRILQQPTFEAIPYKPKKLIVWSLCVGVALFLSFFLIAIAELTRNTIKYKEDIHSLKLDSYVISEIVRFSRRRKEASIVVLENPRSIIADEFRGLRNQINFILARKRKESKTILITSTTSGEGKSFTAINLGVICSLLKVPTIILDLDLRKPSLHQLFSLSNDIGITNYLVQDQSISVEDLIQSTSYQNLDLMVAGPILPNPADFLDPEVLSHLFEELKRRYSYIIVDTSPIGIVKDAEALLPYADLVLYLLRMRYSQFSFVERFLEIKQQGLAPNLYLVLNEVPKPFGQYGYGYSDYYYYYYDKEKKFPLLDTIRKFFL